MSRFKTWNIDLTDEIELCVTLDRTKSAFHIERIKTTNEYALGAVSVPFSHIRELAEVLSEAADYLEGKA